MQNLVCEDFLHLRVMNFSEKDGRIITVQLSYLIILNDDVDKIIKTKILAPY